ncbi:DNA-dependent metalloprotease SPRTN isoform X2 [Condylostylus longicornis]|nr:DNA-dependent metalloprotease SPRTN isoform X2 [Condylostylus longicornis]
MFLTFDNKFFQGRLKCVTLEWSKKMYSCAGICYSRRNSMGMAITIRLSEPLLKLRPRKNLIETLLHEMIHAYCFVLGIREGNGGHGPNFKKIMYGINKVAGTNITVYHTFHDEVDLYKVHWWRCNGICQHRKPFFGYVKRSSNRAPGPNDFWWKAHMESCGGGFLKIKGPDPVKRNKKFKDEVKGKDIRNYFGNVNSSTNLSNGFKTTFKGPVKANGGGTLLINPRTKTFTSTKNIEDKNSNSSKVTGGSLKNVIGLKDLSDEPSKVVKKKSTPSNQFAGTSQGYCLNSSSISKEPNKIPSDFVDRDKIRQIWSQKFSSPMEKEMTKPCEKKEIESNSEPVTEIPIEERRSSAEWEVLSDDILIRSIKPEIISLSDDEENEVDEIHESERRIPASESKTVLTQEQRQIQIKKEILDNSDLSDDDIELIDDDYDDSLTNVVDLTDTSLIDDFFGDDVLLKDFKIENSLVPCGSRSLPDPNKDIVTCPICQSKITREHFENHLDGCIGISIKIEPKSYGGRVVPGSRIIHPSVKKKEKVTATQEEILRKAGYSEQEISNIKITHIDTSISDDPDSYDENLTEGQRRRKGLTTSTHQCPVCGNEVDVNKIDNHLKRCGQDLSPSAVIQISPTKKRNSIPKTSEGNLFQICPVCNKKVRAHTMNEHLDLCLADSFDD